MMLWVLGILGVIVIVNPSDPFKGCVHNNKDAPQYQELHEGNAGPVARVTRFYLRSRLIGVCAANFAAQNERTIGALAAVALALFTLYLWRATHGLRRYAGIQAGDMQQLLAAARDSVTAAISQTEAMGQLRAVSKAQERVMREQAETMAANLALTKNATEAAQTSANAASRLADTMKTAAERQLRAYVSVQLDSLVPQNRVTGYRFELRMIARSTGHTPAHAIRIAGRLRISLFPCQTIWIFRFPSRLLAPLGILIQVKNVSFARPLMK
jgi:hypothetical protein